MDVSSLNSLDPTREAVLAAAQKLRCRTTGVMRGIYSGDPDGKLVRIRISELRAIDRFVCMATRLASALEARQGRDGAAGSIGEADDIATAEGRDAQAHQPKQEGE